VNKPTNQVTKPVQGNLNEEIGLINSPANKVGNNLPAVIDRRTAALQKMLKAAQGEGTGPVIELPTVQEKSLLPVKAGTTALQTYYPPNSGFLKDPIKTTLNPGTKIDRYGYPSGYYTSPVGTPAEMRALPPGTLEKPYTVYEIVKPVDTLSGQAMPWFGQPGLGTQYKFTQSFENMLKRGIIRKVGK